MYLIVPHDYPEGPDVDDRENDWAAADHPGDDHEQGGEQEPGGAGPDHGDGGE